MGVFWLSNIFNKKLDQKGQSAVEYILLITIVTFLISFVFKSKQFTDLFGQNGKFNGVFRRELEYGYRHALGGRDAFDRPNYKSSQHDSYNGRFFGAKEGYPK